MFTHLVNEHVVSAGVITKHARDTDLAAVV